MKIVVKKESLMALLKVVGLTVSSPSPGDEIKSHFVFRHKDGLVQILSTKDRMFSSLFLDCELSGLSQDESENCFTLEAKRLQGWLRAVTEDTVVIQNGLDRRVQAKTKRGQVKFLSENPIKFPFWDSSIPEATCTGTISAERFKHVLLMIHPFISTNETQSAEVCSCELIAGRLFANDVSSACLIVVPELKETTIRIWGKSIPTFVKFLDSCKGTQVEILESENYLLLRSETGSMFGQTRPRNAFPEWKNADSYYDSSHYWWTFNREEMIAAILFLVPSAKTEIHEKSYHKVVLSLEDDSISISLDSAAGGIASLQIPCLQSRKIEDPLPLKKGVPLPSEYFLRILGQITDESVQMGICRVMRDGVDLGGYVAFSTSADENTYLRVLGWYGGV